MLCKSQLWIAKVPKASGIRWCFAHNCVPVTVLQHNAYRLQLQLSFLHSFFVPISGSHCNSFGPSKKPKIQILQRNKRWALFFDKKNTWKLCRVENSFHCCWDYRFSVWGCGSSYRELLLLLSPSSFVHCPHFLMNIFPFLGTFVVFLFLKPDYASLFSKSVSLIPSFQFEFFARETEAMIWPLDALARFVCCHCSKTDSICLGLFCWYFWFCLFGFFLI